MPLVIGPGGNILLGPNGGLAGNTNCCCDVCCGFDVNTSRIMTILVEATGTQNIVTNTIVSQTASFTLNGNPRFDFEVRWDATACFTSINVSGNFAILKSQTLNLQSGPVKCCWWEVTMADPGSSAISAPACQQPWNNSAAWPSNNTFRVPECLGRAGVAENSGCDLSAPCYEVPGTNCTPGGFATVTFQTNLTGGTCVDCPDEGTV